MITTTHPDLKAKLKEQGWRIAKSAIQDLVILLIGMHGILSGSQHETVVVTISLPW